MRRKGHLEGTGWWKRGKNMVSKEILVNTYFLSWNLFYYNFNKFVKFWCSVKMECTRHFVFQGPQGQKLFVSYMQNAYRNPGNLQNRVGDVDMTGLGYRPGSGAWRARSSNQGSSWIFPVDLMLWAVRLLELSQHLLSTCFSPTLLSAKDNPEEDQIES